MILKNFKGKFAVVFGASVISVSLLSGCASPQTMHAVDLESFQINCRIKEQQIRFLQSMRSGRDERMYAGLGNLARPLSRWSDSEEHYQRRSIHSGRTNWLINQHLLHLARDCS
jgi:hypothetical protein